MENNNSVVQVSDKKEVKNTLSYFKIFFVVLIANLISGVLEASPVSGSLLGELVRFIYKNFGH